MRNNVRSGSRFYGKVDSDVIRDWDSYVKTKSDEFLKDLLNESSIIKGEYRKGVLKELEKRDKIKLQKING